MQDMKTLTTRLSGKPEELAPHGEESKKATVEQMNRKAFSKGNLTASHFERLWVRMAEVYGHKWSSQYGSKPAQSWIDGLADMSVEEIRDGLLALKDWQGDDGWPPALFEFRQLCRPRSSLAHEIYKPLPSPKSSFEVRKQAAANAIASLRDGCLKEEAMPKFCLTPEERDLSDKLDWDRIRQVSGQAA